MLGGEERTWIGSLYKKKWDLREINFQLCNYQIIPMNRRLSLDHRVQSHAQETSVKYSRAVLVSCSALL